MSDITRLRLLRVGRSLAFAISTLIASSLVAQAEGRWNLDAAALSPRSGASTVVDTARGVLYRLGGRRESSLGTPGFLYYWDDLWAVDLETGTSRPVATSGTRPHATGGPYAAIFDAERGQLIFVGDNTVWDVGSARHQNVWFLSLSTFQWSQASLDGIASTTEPPGVALDAQRDRLIFWYPSSGLGVWSLSLTGGGWQQLATSGAPPPQLSTRVAAIDPVRDRLVVMAAGGPQEMFALTLGTPMAWSPIPVGGTPPHYTDGNGRAFMDTRLDQLVHVGEWSAWMYSANYSLSTNVVSALRFSGEPGAPLWTTLRPFDANELDLPARYQPGLCFDPRNGRALAVGGALITDVYCEEYSRSPGPSSLDDMPICIPRQWYGLASSNFHEISLDVPGTWKPVPLAMPGLLRQVAALDPGQNRILVAPGGGGETYEVSINGQGTGAYRSLGASSVLPTLSGHNLVMDLAGDRLILFGARFGDPVLLMSMPLHGTPEWSPLVATGTPPGPRIGATAVYDPNGHRMFLFGGDSLGVYKNDTYVLSLDGSPNWTRLLGPAPQARSGHVAVYDLQGDRILMHGGRGTNGLRSDTWELALGGAPIWSAVVLDNFPALPPRQNAAAVLDVARRRLLLFGGKGNAATLDDFWELPLDNTEGWRPVIPAAAGVPPPRSGATSAFDPATGRWWLLGGMNAQGSTFQEIWSFWEDPVLVGVDGDRAAVALRLSPAAPNPSRAGVSFSLSLPSASDVQLHVFDVSGRLVRAIEPRPCAAGRHTLAWDGRDATGVRPAPGLYFIRVATGGAHAIQRVVLTH